MLSARDVSYLLKKNKESISENETTLPDVIDYCRMNNSKESIDYKNIPQILYIDSIFEDIEGNSGIVKPATFDELDMQQLRNLVKSMYFYIIGDNTNELSAVTPINLLDIFPVAAGENREKTMEYINGSCMFRSGWKSIITRLDELEAEIKDLKS